MRSTSLGGEGLTLLAVGLGVHGDCSPPNGLGGSQALDVSPWKTALTVDTRFGPIPQALSKTSCIISELKRIKDIPTLHLLTSPTGYI